jgi:hypothetical protein
MLLVFLFSVVGVSRKTAFYKDLSNARSSFELSFFDIPPSRKFAYLLHNVLL